VREPTVVRWPGKIPAGTVCDELAATIDVLPTLAEIAGAKLPERKIDGQSILPLLTASPQAKTPHEAYYYYWNKELHAVRSGSWKLHFPHSYRSLTGEPGKGGTPGDYVEKKCGLELYNLAADMGEQHDVAQSNPDVVKRLQQLADSIREELGDSLTGKVGTEIRPAGKL
jgi:arylsulfatase A-like enzyme